MDRKEAIEVVRKKVDYYEADKRLKAALEALIPELAESEDEIHRKWILEYLYDGLGKADEQFKDHFKAAIVWLGKQKEQKPVKSNINREYLEERLKGMIDKEGEYYRGAREELAHLFYILGGRPSQYLINNVAKKEQKPAEWTDADQEILERIIKRLRFVIPVPAEDPVRVTFERREDTEAINWLKRRVTSQPQPKQEWSEEDEEMINALIRNQEILIDSASNQQLRDTYSREIEWLKTRRSPSSWKPTKEQMEALMLAIEGKCPPTSYMSRRLEDLYEGLANTFKVECKLENQTDEDES